MHGNVFLLEYPDTVGNCHCVFSSFGGPELGGAGFGDGTLSGDGDKFNLSLTGGTTVVPEKLLPLNAGRFNCCTRLEDFTPSIQSSSSGLSPRSVKVNLASNITSAVRRRARKSEQKGQLTMLRKLKYTGKGIPRKDS
ncbi:hypothetical protein AVEN_47110-1 [Araneus ventricosus]|uniref:Uncharacterized protein n=1 Tax=Araneus ventricosus TaxID=182803 RepID=A0A4Y2LBA9_ARAVE|nr:hypothetical protein AVEN_47110-1 [Araneus ventricosus]